MRFIPKFQDKATTGKQGLGIKDRPKKIAGVRFQGKKTSFSNSDDENSDDFIPPAKRIRDNALEMEKADEPKLKLKKLCKQLLRQVLDLKCKLFKIMVQSLINSYLPTSGTWRVVIKTKTAKNSYR